MEEEGLKRTEHLVSRKQTDPSVFFLVLGNCWVSLFGRGGTLSHLRASFKKKKSKKKKSRFLFLFLCVRGKILHPEVSSVLANPQLKYSERTTSLFFSLFFSLPLSFALALELIQPFHAQLAQVGTWRTWFRAVWVV